MQAIKMTTLQSLLLRSPSSPILRPPDGYNLPSALILVSFKGNRRSASRSRIGCSAAGHGVAVDEPKHRYGPAAARRFSLRKAKGRSDVARKARAQDLRGEAHVETGVAEETNGASVLPNGFEERLLQGSEAKETRLKSIQDADFAGASISSHTWEWRHRWSIHFENAGMENTNAPALLMLPGFGVGTYYYDQQLRDLGQEYRVWTMDFLGQGKSWPSHDPAPGEKVVEEVVKDEANAKAREWGSGNSPEAWAVDLVYSVDTWRDQVHAFVKEVIGGPVYIVGNSLGGFVGTYFAATSPELVKGVTLLNATPVWAFMPNARRNPLLARVFPWAGLLPVPFVVKSAVRVWWDLLRNPQIVRRALNQVYADRSVADDKLVRNMLEATDHPAAFAAFASIVFAPQAHTDFGQNLVSLKERKMPMCMIYGKEDPWIVPFWGQRAKQRNPDAVYYEISPAGHCPHHEAPEVVNVLLRSWVESVESEGALAPSLLEAGVVDQKQQRHWFVVEHSNAAFQDKRMSVRVKGTRGFWRNLLDSIREMFSTQSLQSQIVQTLEKSR